MKPIIIFIPIVGHFSKPPHITSDGKKNDRNKYILISSIKALKGNKLKSYDQFKISIDYLLRQNQKFDVLKFCQPIKLQYT